MSQLPHVANRFTVEVCDFSDLNGKRRRSRFFRVVNGVTLSGLRSARNLAARGVQRSGAPSPHRLGFLLRLPRTANSYRPRRTTPLRTAPPSKTHAFMDGI